jgi:hypothetical protein
MNFEGKEVGVVGSLPGTLTGKAFKDFAMKEEDYTRDHSGSEGMS